MRVPYFTPFCEYLQVGNELQRVASKTQLCIQDRTTEHHYCKLTASFCLLVYQRSSDVWQRHGVPRFNTALLHQNMSPKQVHLSITLRYNTLDTAQYQPIVLVSSNDPSFSRPPS